MESMSRSSRGFPDEDEDDDDEYGRREGSSSHKVDLAGKIDGKNADQKQPSTPRSKHSATEQRRRSKINDRFQILRDLIPHSDQKRDKASFLLEVIEYMRFLQEKVQKYESCPEMPWNSTHGPEDGITDPQLSVKNGPTPPAYMFSGNDNSVSVAPAMFSNLLNPSESDPNLYTSVGRGSSFIQPQQRLIPDSNNMASESHSQWHRPQCLVDCMVSSDTSNEQEELIVDEGTINMSNAYSQGLLDRLTQSLESSGLDLSQASISVQINLGKRARRPATTTSSAKDHDDPLVNRAMGHSVVGSRGEESEQASKKHRSDNS